MDHPHLVGDDWHCGIGGSPTRDTRQDLTDLEAFSLGIRRVAAHELHEPDALVRRGGELLQGRVLPIQPPAEQEVESAITERIAVFLEEVVRAFLEMRAQSLEHISA